MRRSPAGREFVHRVLSFLVFVAAVGCMRRTPSPHRAAASSGTSSGATLRDAYRGAFLIGASIGPSVFDSTSPAYDARAAALVAREFNTVTAENALKWETVHPRPGVYDWRESDAFVAFAERHGMAAIGHTLVWHEQVPAWVFTGPDGAPASPDTLRARLREHIAAVVGRYRGRVHGWDVVNEALEPDGSLRRTPWLAILGPGYVAEAFRAAHAADPSAELYYNDHGLEHRPKRAGLLRLVARLRAEGVPIDGVGSQEHQRLSSPSPAAVDSALTDLATTGLPVHVTELDVDVLPRPEELAAAGRDGDLALGGRAGAGDPRLDPYRAGLPDSVQRRLAQRYGELFAVYRRHAGPLVRVTFWNATDAGSWLNTWPVPGRVNHPLLFDREGHRKPAYEAVLGAAR